MMAAFFGLTASQQGTPSGFLRASERNKQQQQQLTLQIQQPVMVTGL